MKTSLKIMLSTIAILAICGIGLYAFLVSDITKVDVSNAVVVPENYENLLVLDVTINPNTGQRSDIFLHNGQAGSSIGSKLSSFDLTDWYSDHNSNQKFDGNQIASDNEATIYSLDDILDPSDSVKNAGLAFIKPFRYANGIYEQYIDNDHSNSYTKGEAIIRTSITGGLINQGDLVLGGLADMTNFPPYIKFADGIQGTLSPPKYQNGEAIIIDVEPIGILSDADTIISYGKADLKQFPTNTAYSDVNNDRKFSSEEAIIIDNGTQAKLDPADVIVHSGNANLTKFLSNERYADSNNNDLFDQGELFLVNVSDDSKIRPENIRFSGFANLRSLTGENLFFSDSNKNNSFDKDELIVKNNGDANILELSDIIFKSGKANLKVFQNGIEKYIDSNNNGIYDDGECIVNDIDDILDSDSIEKHGFALLLPFSGKNYLFTDANNNKKYTNGEAIFRDINNNGLIENGELVKSGYASIKPFPEPLWFIDFNGNNIYDFGESVIISNDNKLSIDDSIVVEGRAFLTSFPQGIIKWAEVNNNDKYDDDELIISSIDNILNVGEVIKQGLCGLKPFPETYNNYFYSDANNSDSYSSDELVIASGDNKLDSGDYVIKAGKANLMSFQSSSMLFIDSNNNGFDQNDVIINNNNPNADVVLLDSSDVVVKTGTANIKPFDNDIVYIDVNNDSVFQGDADSDVIWNKLGDPIDPNDPDIITDQDEVVLKDAIGSNHLLLDDGDIVLRPGVARLRNFANERYIDHYNLGEFTGTTENEAIIQDNNGILESTDIVIVAGKAIITDFSGERYIDNNNDFEYTDGEAIWRDNGTTLNKLDPNDEIVKAGYASLVSLAGYKYTNDGMNPSFTGAQAIIADNEPFNILSRNDIQAKPGTADIKAFNATENFIDCDGDGKYTDGEPIFHYSGQTKIVANPGILMAFPDNYRYIDSDDSGFYNASGSPLAKTSTEAIINDNGDRELNAGALDGTGADKVLVSGNAKIKPIGEYASKLNPQNPNINAYLDKNLNNQLDDYETLIRDNDPVGLLDPSDYVYGKVLFIDDYYNWSDTPIVQINGSTLNPPNSSINAYIDSYNIGFLDNYEILIIDNNPKGLLGSNDIIMGEIKNKNTLSWSANLENEIPWRQLMKNFNSQEKFLTSRSVNTYAGQPIINESTGTRPNQWDSADLMVYDGTPPVSISNNWQQVKYIDNNHNGNYDYSYITNIGECILDFSLMPVGSEADYPNIIITEGTAGFGEFQAGLKFCDQFNNNGIYEVFEPLVNDVNNNNMIDQGEVVSEGNIENRSLQSPFKYIDSNHNGQFNGKEAIIIDGNLNNLLDVGRLDGSGLDKVITAGLGDLTQFNRSEKYIDGNNNSLFDLGEAILYDWFDQSSYRGEFILAGDHVNRTGALTYLQPNNRIRDCVLMPSQYNKAGITRLNSRTDQKYIDTNQSNSYNGFYDVWNGIDYEPIISSSNDQLDKGKLDGTGIDKILASGYCLKSWNSETKWTDSNLDLMYQDNEAIVYDAFNDNIISSIGVGINDDKILMSGDANLKGFANMKYLDANNNNDIDENELIVKDKNQDNKVSNDEISQSGIIPLLKTFTSTDYRYCDWNQNSNYDPQEEAIIYTPIEPDILGKQDEIVASGTYPALKGFGSQAGFIDSIQNNTLDDNEAIIIGNGDQIIDENEQIIISGIATSFDGTNIKYTALNSSSLYTNGYLIADSIDDILEGNEIITAGRANTRNFNPIDFYIDNNHNGRYDYKAYNGTFGEAIISDTTGNLDIIEAGEIKTNGFAGLLTFDGTNYKYSDSGERDQQYNIDELLINDINGDSKVDPSEIVFSGVIDIKSFPENIKYCDNNRNNQYDGIEAIVISDNDVLDSTDTIWGEGEANLRQFEQNLYRFADSNHDGIYSNGEAIVVEVGWSNADDILEESDIILLAGTADLEQFPAEFMFLDDLGNSGEYEDGEAIVYDANGNSMLDIGDEIIKSGRASIKRFASSERYCDGGENANNSFFDPDEAIIRDGNTDGKLSAGPLDGTGTDAVISQGKAGLRRFNINEKYVDSNNNSQYDGNEDIYSDEDNNNIVTGEGNDQLVYFVVENLGTAENTDILSVSLWADRDKDGIFEPYTDDAPKIKSLAKDSLNPKIWYEGPANSPPLSANSSRNPIGYPIDYNGQRFFVSLDTTNRPIDGRDIQMSIPINGIGTLYGYLGPTDLPIINTYRQYIDSAQPNLARIISPKENDTVYGNVLIRVEADDSVGIGKVEFYDGQDLIGIDDNGSPWEILWYCNNVGFGLHTLYARVYDKTYLRPPKTNTINHYLNSSGVNVVVGISYSIPLNSGWNYISLPIEPFNNNVSFIMSSIGNNARSIWTYDSANGNWLRYDLDGPSFLNDLDIVKAGVGYQIFMANPGILNVSGVLPETFISLQDGWNFVGWNSDTPMNTLEAISSIISNQPSIWTINPTNGEWLGYDPNDPPNDLMIIEPGKAYWVYVVGNCIWQMNSQ